ncbi:MAG TPA: SOS response-associated peptidase [Rhizomicrobium sp.]|nr:SOS response-associated peptidase [Rhizomicrobium sp.]
MCGKFTQMMSWSELVTLADLVGAPRSAVETVTPMRFATVIRLDAHGKREAVRMRWGLVPSGARDPSDGTRFIHARAETIEQKPTFRDAFFNRRGLVVVSTFNEGKEITPKKTEQYVVTPTGRAATAIAVIWERWSDHNAGTLETFAMVTVPPNALIATITDRMPALVGDEDWAKWLGEEEASLDDLKAALRTSDLAMNMEKAGKPPPKPARQPDLF